MKRKKSKKKYRLFWGSDIQRGDGNSYGYYIHNKRLKEYTSKIAEITEDSKKSLVILSPEFIKKIPDKINFVFTMFEGTTIPDIYLEKLNEADYLIAPSSWVKELFDNYFPENKSFIVPHGIENIFTYKKRKLPNTAIKPFRFLWLSAPNPRKGWEEMVYLWDKGGFIENPNVELYVKTTKGDGIDKRGNVIFDGRNISDREIVKLYHSSHCYMFPTRGEGFGLTLAEAMRTGLPCISTQYSGLIDFFDSSVGYSIGYELGDGLVKFPGDQNEIETKIAFPRVDEIFEAMLKVLNNYDEALELGRKASKRISTKFTWQRSAEILCKEMSERGGDD